MLSDLKESIIESFLGNGVGFEVEDVTPEEVKEEIQCNGAFRRLTHNPNLINKLSHWVKIAYGTVFAFVGERQVDDRLEVWVDVDEDCPMDDFKEMIVEGIEDYAYDIDVETENIKWL